MTDKEDIHEVINEAILEGPEYGSGFVNDPETDCMVLLWIKIHRDTFQKCDYVIPSDSPEGLRKCLETMKDIIKDKPIISVKLMKEDDILSRIDSYEETGDYRRYSAMALCVLNQAFEDHMRKRFNN